MKIFGKNFPYKISDLPYFSNLLTIYSKTLGDMEYKRKQRSMNDITKQKISASLKGRKKSFQHCQNISKGLEGYWQQIPQQQTGNTTTDGLV